MEKQIRIAAKDLGQLVLPDFCPRCFWLKLRLRNQLPFQIFPGIFSSIDSYNKRIVHTWFDKYHKPPVWMSGLGDIIGYREPPHHSKFYLNDPSTGVLLTGSPDGIFIRGDGSHLIVDYKTARYTGTQDQLYPMYEVQLNAYTLIGESLNLKPVSGLALIYMEPITDSLSAAQDENHRDYGFSMGFSAHILEVKLDLMMLSPLLARTRDIYTLEKSPEGLPGCSDCRALQEIFRLVSR
ncbi:MAG: PD-(D/E)XK nuclease family protein [Thermodesulfobacteriota bacterium]|nr:MAG: PD-(D/E)XK nuclease family protein [Thermodesulfobacteriota bacterium]